MSQYNKRLFDSICNAANKEKIDLMTKDLDDLNSP